MSSRAGAGLLSRRERLARLEADRELLAREHPYLAYQLDESRLVATATGAVPVLLPDGDLDPIEIGVDFHHEYPPRAPTVLDAARRWIPDDDRHIPGDHTFCLYLRDADEPNLARPESLHLFMLDVICFLEQQLIYDRIGRFPGPEWPHQRDAYALYIIEQLPGDNPADESLWDAVRGVKPARNDRCPCGSGTKFKRCHQDLVVELAQIAAPHKLTELNHAELRALASRTA